MRTRMLLSASAIALVAASCSQPEPQVLSEAPRSTTAADLTSATEPTSSETEPGRFIARCSTEADGGTPGMTVFTDGSQGVTDHCLSRYYIGVQPAPGALYVPDDDAGTYAPSRSPESGTTTTHQWTPAQPRTDADPDDGQIDRNGELDDDDNVDGETDPQDPDGTETDPQETETGVTTPSTPVETTVPGEDTTTPGDGTTVPGEPTDPGDVEPTLPPGETDPTTPGSSEPQPTTVPTVTETPEPSNPTTQTSVTSTAPSGPAGGQGSAGPGGSDSLAGSSGPHGLPYPFGSSHLAPPTTVQTHP